MSILTGILTSVVEWLLSKAGSAIMAMIKAHERKVAVTTEEKASVEPLKAAVTSDEISKATDDTLSGL